MKKLSFAAVALAIALSGSSANAATITLANGTSYDVQLVTGTFQNNQALLEGQIFFGNGTLATQLATAVFNTLGTPNSLFAQPIGPLFVTSRSLTTIFGAAFAGGVFGNSIQAPNYQTNQSLTFATVVVPAAVPLPASILLLLSTCLGLGALGRRKKPQVA